MYTRGVKCTYLYYMVKGSLYKYFYVIFLVVFVGSRGVAQQEAKVVWEHTPRGISILNKTPDYITVKIHLSGADFRKVVNKNGQFLRISHPELTSSYQEGFPDLPVLRKLLEIPAGASVRVDKVTWKSYHISLEKKFPGAKLFPAQPSVMKIKERPPPVFKIHKKAYTRDTFFSDSLVRIQKAGVLRGHELAYLTVSPFSYNPVSNTLIVKDDIELTIRYSHPFHVADRYKSKSLYSPVFQPTYNKLLSVETLEAEDIPTAPVKYVILTDSLFRYSLDDFIRWKTLQGYKVLVVYKGAPGVGTTPGSIRAYLKSLYDAATPDDPAPTFLLIVGDTEQIPVSTTTGRITDLYYATYDGEDDFIPDVYYGRFSARDSADLVSQLEKILEYEQYLFPDPSFLHEAVMVAGVDGSYASVWGNGQINYATENYVNPSHGYQSHTYLYPVSGSSDAQIIQDISNGVSLVNYTGHGRSDRWEDPTFTISDIAKLTNAHKYPVIITNGCSTGAFGNDECFAEAMLRAPKKGAVGYIGSSYDSYWNEDYYWAVGVGPIVAHPDYKETSLAMYDRLFHDHGEPADDWYVTQDQMIFAGNLAVMEGNPSKAQYYWEIYHLFGDPSMMPYLSEPDTLMMLVPETVPVNLSNLTIVTEPGTYVGLTKEDTILDALTAGPDGNPMLSFTSLKDTGYIVITGTRQNRIPFIDTIRVVSDQQPYLQVHGIVVDDSVSNANGLPENGETLYLDIRVKNTGKTDATQVTCILSGHGSWIEIKDSVVHIASVPSENDILIPHAFRIRIRDSVPDMQICAFRIRLTDDAGQTWNSYFPLKIYAPLLKVGRLILDDKNKGNGNSRLEPGEPVVFSLEVQNRGHAAARNAFALILLTDSLVSDYQDSAMVGVLDTMSTVTVPFTVEIDSAAPYGSILGIHVEVYDDPYVVVDTFTLPVGLSFEDFESGSFLNLPWQNNTSHPWTITGQSAWHGDFSAVSAAIDNSEESSLSINIEASTADSVTFYFRVSSEEDWDFLKFFIDGLEKGKWSGELPWTYGSFPVDSGSHVLKWTYIKDANTSKGMDRAWLDYIIFPKYSFTRINAGITGIVSPKSGPDLGNAEPLTVIVRNFGTDPLYKIPLMYRLNQDLPVRDTLIRTLLSGDTAWFTFSVPLDLSVLKEYHLHISSELTEDQVPVNDGIDVDIMHEGTIDVIVDSLVSPARDSLYRGYEHIAVLLINASSGALDSFPLHYRINYEPTVSQSFDTVVNAGDTALFRFVRQENMVDTGKYVITVYATVTGDVISSNDTLVVTYNKVSDKNDLPYASSVTVYPNPAGDFLFIQLFSGKAGKNFHLAVFDMSGKKVVERTDIKSGSGEQVFSISINHLPAGTCLLILYNREEKIPVPFVKE